MSRGFMKHSRNFLVHVPTVCIIVYGVWHGGWLVMHLPFFSVSWVQIQLCPMIWMIYLWNEWSCMEMLYGWLIIVVFAYQQKYFNSRLCLWRLMFAQSCNEQATPYFAFQPFPVVKMGFRSGMKLEGIDPRHPSLYCVLTVAEIRGFRLRLHFDGYSECFDFWTNADSPFIFPVGWVEKNGKVLHPPVGKKKAWHEWDEWIL